jgi:tetratricopeptide (TPR) repeat protein
VVDGEAGVGGAVAACDHCGAASEIAYGFVSVRPRQGTLCSPCWERRRVGAYAVLLFLPVVVSALVSSPIWWWLGLHPLLFLAVGIHEAGHALVGRLVAFRVFEVQVGTGPRLATVHVGGTRVELRAVPLCGFTSWAPTRPEGYSERLFAAVAAGPLVNLAAVAAAIVLLPASPWALVLGATNGWLALRNLLPHGASSPARGSGNDGAALCRPRPSPAEAGAALALAPYWESVVRWKDGDHLGARRVAEEALARHPGWVSAQDVLASALIGLGHYEEARETLLAVLDAPDPPEGLRATALLSLAWADLCSGDPELLPEADAASQAAVRLLPWLAAARTARALALVERGDPAAGLALVPSPWRGGLDRRERASAAAVRARSLARLGQRQRSRRHLAWAAWLDPRCSLLAPAWEGLNPAAPPEAIASTGLPPRELLRCSRSCG